MFIYKINANYLWARLKLRGVYLIIQEEHFCIEDLFCIEELLTIKTGDSNGQREQWRQEKKIIGNIVDR